jgi:hypothetical protein
MRALQALVIFQGALIVVGLIAVVAAMVYGPKHPAPTMAAASPPTDIAIPPGFRVTEMVATSDRVVIRLDGRDGAQRLLVLDPVSGAVSASIGTGVAKQGVAP